MLQQLGRPQAGLAFRSSTKRARVAKTLPCAASRRGDASQSSAFEHQPQSAPSQPPFSMMGLPASVIAATVLFVASPSLAITEQMAAGAVSEYIEQEAKGKFKTSKALEDFRSKYSFKRTADGRLQLRSSRGEWYQCRLDMEVPGSMLLRDSKGNVYALQTEVLQQIDLSDDLVALMMFGSGDWEKQMSAVEFVDEQGQTKQLQLSEKEFREVIGLLKEAEESLAEVSEPQGSKKR